MTAVLTFIGVTALIFYAVSLIEAVFMAVHKRGQYIKQEILIISAMIISGIYTVTIAL